MSGFCCRIGAALEIFDADGALLWVSIELGVRKRFVCQSNAGIVPGVLWFLQRESARDDSGPQRGPADGRLAAHVQLPAAHVAALVDLLQGEPRGVIAGFSRVLHRRECVGGRPGCFRHHRPHQPQADGYDQALQRESKPREPDHHLLPAALIDCPPRVLLSAFRFYLLWRDETYNTVVFSPRSDIPEISFFREGAPDREPRDPVAGLFDGALDLLLLGLPSLE